MTILAWIGVMLFAAVIIHAADWAAASILWLGVAVLVLVGTGLALWHRHRLAEIHELRSEAIGHWRRVSRVARWPKACLSCGAATYDWKGVRAHGDPARSACAAHTASVPAAELAADSREIWSVTVGRGAGSGAVDTLADERKPELEP